MLCLSLFALHLPDLLLATDDTRRKNRVWLNAVSSVGGSPETRDGASRLVEGLIAKLAHPCALFIPSTAPMSQPFVPGTRVVAAPPFYVRPRRRRSGIF